MIEDQRIEDRKKKFSAPSHHPSSAHPPISSSKRRRRLFPQTIAQSCEPLLKPLYKKHGFAQHRILTEWPSIVGPELAACSAPCKLGSERGRKEGNVLHITVSASRALELQHMQPVIIERINGYFGCAAVTSLRLLQAPAGTFRSRAKAAPPPQASTANAWSAKAALCDDPELRAALLSLASLIGGES